MRAEDGTVAAKIRKVVFCMDNTGNRSRKAAVTSVVFAGLLFAAPQLAIAEEVPASQQAASVSSGQPAVTEMAAPDQTENSGSAEAQTALANDSGKQEKGSEDEAQKAAEGTAEHDGAKEAAAPSESGKAVEAAGTSQSQSADAASEKASSAVPQNAAAVTASSTATSTAASPSAEKAEAAPITSYSSLADAIAASTDGQTLTLAGDIDDLSGHLTISGKSIVIDGGGHAIRRASGYTGEFFNVEKGGALTLRDVILEGGGAGWYVDYDHGNIKDTTGGISSVPVSQGTAQVNSTGSMVTNRGTLVLDKATLKDAYSTKVSGVLVYSAPGSKLEIDGGSVLQDAYSPDAPVLVDGGCDFAVDGATFDKLASGGGGLHILSSAADTMPTIKNATFSSCFSGFNGGSIYCARNAIDISDSTFENSTTCNDGGSICMTPGVKNTPLTGGTSTFKNVKFLNSRGLSPYNQSLGSAIFLHVTYGGAYVFEDCLFSGNEGCAGVVCDYGSGKLGAGDLMPMTFTRCTFEGNKETEIAAIDARTLDVTLDDCKIVNNTAANQCGAIGLEGNSRCTLENGTIITGNSAGTYGGAIRFWGNNVFTMEAGSKLYGNTAGKGGDDIYSGNGTDYAPTIVLVDGSTMNAATADGHAIDGWYFDMPDGIEEGSGRYQRNVSEEQKDLTIHTNGMIALKADASTFTVSYDPNASDAEGTMADEEFGRSDAAALAKNAFTRSGWRFAGWALTKDGTASLGDGDVLPDSARPERGGKVTVYAVWEKEPEKKPEDKPSSNVPGNSGGKESGPAQGDDSGSRAHMVPVSDAAQNVPEAQQSTSAKAQLPETGDVSGAGAAIMAFVGSVLAALGFSIRKTQE